MSRIRETIASPPFRELVGIVLHSMTWRALAWVDIRSKYRRTKLGPWWLTLSNGLMALGIGLVFGGFFGNDMRTYLPFFIIGMTVWGFISSALNEAAVVLVQSGELIKATRLPLAVYVMRSVQRNFLIFLHNILIVPVIWVFVPWPLEWSMLLAVVGMGLIFIFAGAASLAIAIVCVRYRDIPPLIGMAVQFLFFVTPIIWMPEQMRTGKLVVTLNPLGYMMSVARDPLLGRPVAPEAWAIAAAAGLLSVAVATAFYLRYRNRVVYWV